MNTEQVDSGVWHMALGMNRPALVYVGQLVIGTWHLALGSNEQADTWIELLAGSNTAAACPPALTVILRILAP